jgi:hypothetical protein
MHEQMNSWHHGNAIKLCQGKGNPSRGRNFNILFLKKKESIPGICATCSRENHEALTLKHPLDGTSTTGLRMHGCIPGAPCTTTNLFIA